MYVLENEPSFQGKHSSTLIKAQVSIFLDMYLILSFLGAKAGSQFLFKRHPNYFQFLPQYISPSASYCYSTVAPVLDTICNTSIFCQPVHEI